MSGDRPLEPETVAGDGNASAAWWLYRATGERRGAAVVWPPAPPWRQFDGGPVTPAPPSDDHELDRRLGAARLRRPPNADQLNVINAALLLRRPLLVTGRPGVGKSSLAYQIARELELGPVLHWGITSRSSLRSALYGYDAMGRAQAVVDRSTTDGGAPPSVGSFVSLGPLGTALLPHARPRVLLVDELDKSDVDLPNDLLNIFEDGWFTIPELVRVKATEPTVEVLTADPGGRVRIDDGVVRCRAFPVVVITSNGERDFPAPFLRRCIRLDLPVPDRDRLAEMVAAHFAGGAAGPEVERLIDAFVDQRGQAGDIAADQLLNAVYLAAQGARSGAGPDQWEDLLRSVWRRLSSTER